MNQSTLPVPRLVNAVAVRTIDGGKRSGQPQWMSPKDETATMERS